MDRLQRVNKIILHHSASSFGDVAIIRDWHTDRGWRDIGYHYVILNGGRGNLTHADGDDGLVEAGRDVKYVGAHCMGQNTDSIGICLVGNGLFSVGQIMSLRLLLRKLFIEHHNLDTRDVYGHKHFRQTSCPGFNEEHIRLLTKYEG